MRPAAIRFGSNSNIRIPVLAGLLLAGASAHAVEADLRWTRYGVPHVKAKDYEGLGYGCGYAIAGHHLCLVADKVWTVRGERSRVFGIDGSVRVGASTVPNLDGDLFYRVQLADDNVEGAWRQLSSNAKDLVNGYVAGLNRYVGELAPEARSSICKGTSLPAFQASDVVRVAMQIGTLWTSGVAATASQSTWENLSASAPSPSQSAKQQAHLESPAASRPVLASNTWAYGSDATGTGTSIVVGNPHTPWKPSWTSMHQLHLTIPGEIDVAGADFVGFPLPLVGYTNDIAWSIESPQTVTYHLLLSMQVSAGAEPSYVIDGQRHPLTSKLIEIDVRAQDGNVRRRSFRIPYSQLGALYRLDARDRRPAGWYAITDANAKNARVLDQMLAVAKSRNIAELEQAVAANRGMTTHLIAGDRHGTSIYTESGPLLDIDDAKLAGCAVVKGQGLTNVVDGTRSECIARTRDFAPKLAPPEKLPALKTRGIVHNSNDSYRYAIFGQQLFDYSVLLGDPLKPPYDLRTLMSERHIRELMSDGRITLPEALDVMFSNRSYVAETSLDGIIAACASAAENSPAARGCRILRNWDRRSNADSRGALLFQEAWKRLQDVEGLYVTPFDAKRPFQVRQIAPTPAVTRAIVTALEESVQTLEKLGLRGDEPWGSMLARTTSAGKQPLNGGDPDQGVLNAMWTGPLTADGFNSIADGTSYAFAVTWEQGRLVAKSFITHGQSFDPASPHYSDQLAAFQQKQLMVTPFTDAEIEADPGYQLVKLSKQAAPAGK